MVKITKGGKLYYKQFENDRWKNATENLLSFLTINPRSVCSIDENVTLNDVFKLIKKHKDVLTKILHPKLEDFLLEIKKRPTGECEGSDYLEVYWCPSYLDKEIDDGIYIHLIKDSKNITGDFGEDCPCSILFTPINEMKNLPMRLNKDYNIGEFGKEEALIDLKKEFHLIDILSCIMWNITWFGGPGDRSRELKKMEKDINGSKRYS